MAHIDYYYAGASPFSYLGHRAFEAVARKHGCGIAYKPVKLADLWQISGAVVPAERPPVLTANPSCAQCAASSAFL